LINLWKYTWIKNGWKPIILNQTIAQKHLLYEKYYSVIKSFPTINTKEYENACFLRWLAMSVVGGGFMSDYDVINKNFVYQREKMVYKRPVIYQGLVPSLVFGDEEDYLKFVQLFISYKPDTFEKHISDMVILSKQYFQKKNIYESFNIIKAFKEPYWTKAKLIHFAHNTIPKKIQSRCNFIKQKLNYFV